MNPASQGLNELEREWHSPLVVLLSMASVLLLIACANLANLLAARATNRRREIGVRLALGATRSRIARLLLIESAALALAGTVVGVACAPLMDRLFLAVLPKDALGGWVSGGLNLPILGFSALVMIAVTILCGLAPSLQAIRAGLPGLSERTASAGRTSAGARKTMVAAQIALSMVLLVGAGLFARSLANLMRHDLGFRSDRLLTFSIDAGLNGYTVDRGLAFYKDLGRKLESVSGVDSVAMAGFGPLSHSTAITNVTVEGYTPKSDDEMNVRIMAVGPGYFRTLGTPLIDGREFEERDARTAPKVAVVNQAFVRRFFGDHSALGRHMSMGSGGPLDITIAGVVRDTQNSGFWEAASRHTMCPTSRTWARLSGWDAFRSSFAQQVISRRFRESCAP